MFFRRLNWNVVGWFKTVSLISYIVIGLGIATMLYHAFTAPGGGFQPSKALQLGLSFTGGTAIDVKFDRSVSQDDIRKALATINVTDEKINTISKANEPANDRYTIATQRALGDSTEPMWKALGKVATVDRAQSKIESVGPSLGREYLIKAIWALVIALSIQFLYIAFRFGWNYIFGLVTIIALVRDAAMMIGIYAIANKAADDAFLAAVLTVIGYSVMDTIVILDRIRENTKLMGDVPYDKIVNTSILQTMTRSFNTLATVVITLVALLALGGASLQNFAFALLVGIVSGGYHSIFYSAPLVLVFRKRQLEAATQRRRMGLSTDRDSRPRTVAESKALASRGGVAREDIVAARQARRKSKSPRTTPGPVRYKRKRDQGATGTIDEQQPGSDQYEEDQMQYEGGEQHDEMDPLDAQNAGMHEQAMDQGHEEVNLNLEGFETEHPVSDSHDPAAEHESAPKADH
ncbi:MAG: protein translocase subunit SecF [Candidatus Eremiobacteraeota bacterium]|nr:protein translocase subunit SecF [Candidatus Eremiobacteraeota bacterium]